ncbi:MAG: hypothetical protein IIZ19_02185 [Clostridia bacterium]|nr:hypothetical protein [Clostridia bacterium]
MKRIIALILALSMVLVFAACGSNDKSSGSSEQTEEAPEALVFTLDGTENEYSTTVTLNADTDMPVSYIAYHIPAGTYTVTNNKDVFDFVYIYTDETHVTEEGWEEVADAFVSDRMEPGDSTTVTISDGWYVKGFDNQNLTFEQISE